MANFKDLSTRAITGVLFFALIISSGYFGGAVGFLLMFAGLIAICTYEWGKLCNLSHNKSIMYSALFLLTSILTIKIPVIIIFFTLLLPFFIFTQLRYKRFGLITGLLYLTLAFVTVYKLVYQEQEYLDWWVSILFIWATVICVDVCAYVCGRIIGGKKLAPKISPNKTIAGFVGGVLIGGLFFVSSLYYVSLFFASTWVELFMVFLFGVIISVFSQIGDLYQSHIKRVVGVKDSGKILPGHGGIFDRLDGLLMALIYVLVFFQVSILII